MECIFATDLELSRADGLNMRNGSFYFAFWGFDFAASVGQRGHLLCMALFIMVFSIPIKYRLGL
jgi:hypothetical protein